jgi:putative endonuclease
MRPAAGPGIERKRRAYRLGLSAELRAVWWLRLKGYRILARRFSRGLGEIDIIARRGRVLAFVEVKARTTADAALLALTHSQRRRILRAAEAFAAAPQHQGCDLRFDVMLVPAHGWPRHLRAAFDATA